MPDGRRCTRWEGGAVGPVATSPVAVCILRGVIILRDLRDLRGSNPGLLHAAQQCGHERLPRSGHDLVSIVWHFSNLTFVLVPDLT